MHHKDRPTNHQEQLTHEGNTYNSRKNLQDQISKNTVDTVNDILKQFERHTTKHDTYPQ